MTSSEKCILLESLKNRKSEGFIDYCKSIITSWCEHEYGHIPDFNDLENVGLAYTVIDDPDEEKHELQITADLLHRKIMTFIDGDCYEVKSYSQQSFVDLLKYMDFNDLIHISDEVWRVYMSLKTNKQGSAAYLAQPPAC